MNLTLMVVAVVVGLGTYLFRFLPTRLPLGQATQNGPLGRFLAGMGPAAIATLFTASILPGLSLQLATIGPTAIGSLTVVLAFLWRRNVAIATLAGALAYGVVFALLS